MGTYPETSLKEACAKRDAARKQLALGIDPGENRNAMKADGETFEVIAREWFAKYKPTWTASHADKIIARLKKDIFPWIGKQPIAALPCVKCWTASEG